MLRIVMKQNTNCQLLIGNAQIYDSKAFSEYAIDMDDICKNIEECNSNKKFKILTVLHDMIADVLNDKNLDSIVTE